MKVKYSICLMISALFLVRCGKDEKAELEKNAQLMAVLECEARQLKEERFNAANEIRLMEDSLAKHHMELTVSQNQHIDSVKNEYTLRTGQLANKITKTMDSLFAVSYQTPEERQMFDVAVEKRLQEVCK